MTVIITPSILRLTWTPLWQYIGALMVMLIAGIGAAGNMESSLDPASGPWTRGACAVMVLIGAILFLQTERVDHRFDRARGTIELSWQSLIRSRRRVLRLADVTGVVTEEDEAAENGRPTRIVLQLSNASRVRLSESYAPRRKRVLAASRTLSRFLGVPGR